MSWSTGACRIRACGSLSTLPAVWASSLDPNSDPAGDLRPRVTGLACPSVRECRLKSDALRLTIGEIDGEEPVRAIETLELHLATLRELDS